MDEPRKKLDGVYNAIWMRVVAALFGILLVAWAYWAEGLESFVMTVLLPVSAGLAILASIGWLSEAFLIGVSSDSLRSAVASRINAMKPDLVKEAEAARAAPATA